MNRQIWEKAADMHLVPMQFLAWASVICWIFLCIVPTWEKAADIQLL